MTKITEKTKAGLSFISVFLATIMLGCTLWFLTDKNLAGLTTQSKAIILLFMGFVMVLFSLGVTYLLIGISKTEKDYGVLDEMKEVEET